MAMSRDFFEMVPKSCTNLLCPCGFPQRQLVSTRSSAGQISVACPFAALAPSEGSCLDLPADSGLSGQELGRDTDLGAVRPGELGRDTGPAVSPGELGEILRQQLVQGKLGKRATSFAHC
nr:hypothetical protein Iba_chr04aCG8560 [Ipomoea batatas]